MHRDKKLILYTLGGAAVIAGAFIYFKRRNMTIQQKYQNLFHQLQQDILTFKSLNQGNYQLKYDKLLYLAIYDENDQLRTVTEKITFQETEELKNQGACNQKINIGACYYECFDCSPARQENAKTNKGMDDNVICQAICEDCFKAQGHKNHKFIRHEYSGFGYDRCQCGIESIVDKKCFCNQHQGFDKIKQLCNSQLLKQPKIWKGVEQFFIDSFYIYFEIVSNAIRQKLNNHIDEKTYNQQLVGINYYLQLIINKINEIIELNTPSTYLITSILSMPFEKPISFQVQRNSNDEYPNKYVRLIQKQKQVNKDLSVLDCLLLNYEVVDNLNDELLSNLFRSLSIADEQFSAVICEKFFRMVGFIARNQKSQDEWQNKNKLPNFAHLVMENIFIQSIFDNLIEKLGVDIFNPIEYLTFYVKNQILQSNELDQNIIILPNICFDMFRFVNQLKSLLKRYPKESIKAINNLSFVLYLRNSVKVDLNQIYQKQFEDITKGIKSFVQYTQVEIQVIDAYINIFEGLLLINDQSLTQNMIALLCDGFTENVVNLSEQIEENQNFCSFSISFLSQLPFLIAISEKKIFTKSSIQNFFNTKLKFKDQEQKANFFKCIKKIISNFILANNRQIYNMLQIIFDEVLQEYTQFIESLNYYLYNPQSKVYDIYQISSSICLLAEDCNDNLAAQNTHIQTLLSIIDNLKQGNNSLRIQQYFCISYSICQMLLDSTPLLNLFSNKIELFFPGFSLNEDTLIKKNVEELIVSCIQEYQLEKMYLNDLQQICQAYLNNTDIVKQYYLGTVNQQENQDFIFLKQQYTQKLYPRHLMRNLIFQFNEIIQAMAIKNNDSSQELSYAGSDFSIENLFPYQQDLFKRIFLNAKCVNTIIDTNILVQSSLQSQNPTTQLLYMLLKFMIQSNQSKIFNESEKLQIEEMIQIIPFYNLKNKFQTDINFLKEKKLYHELKMSEFMLGMLCQLEQQKK
ncbi:N-recognin zinc finger protein (macronuclear) [Tetrahymena thermophila SB210]|uniref:N-recognin zinc finger protein n=1 Tax=Tetrahymena thermophila (strain SB210) TaxID=312017 RepID=Q23C16_TETTS|nr:N-recognin zinc finger protein [Tetrahymena thermophila SB210]EAR93952.2 N-recognin zinc finger protein [Tetrahymena thermophila SB210]|eukprot:XP_001014197.2 N-recognin zinc finger protein [Tetrahymena thermophila SB210]